MLPLLSGSVKSGANSPVRGPAGAGSGTSVAVGSGSDVVQPTSTTKAATNKDEINLVTVGLLRCARYQINILLITQANVNIVTLLTMTTKEAKESILSIQVDTALSGNDSGPFEPVAVLTGGHEAGRRKCNQSAWVGIQG